MVMTGLMTDGGRLRDAFVAAGFTIDGVRDRLGPVAGGALAREEIVPALRTTAGADPLDVLIRLWWLQVPVPRVRVTEVLGAGGVRTLLTAGMLREHGDQVRATVHIQPYGTDAYVVSDPVARPGDAPPSPDHVVGTGGASAGLAQLVNRAPVGRALDLGTGCGVQAIELAGRADTVCATDVNPRALDYANASLALSGVPNAHTREGDLFEPVDGETFDLIVSNPPFVIGPHGRYTYRESGLPGDEVGRILARRAPRHLAPGGWCHLLANWLHVDGADWRDRVGGWLLGTECDGWVVQRDVQDPAQYVELWLRDSVETGTPRYRERYEDWLDWFEREKVTGIGFGWITLHASGSSDPVVRVEELTHAVEQPVGGYLAGVFDGLADAHRRTDAELLNARLRTAETVTQEYVGPPGFTDPERIVLRQSGGLRRAAAVDTATAALAGVCDGTLPVGPLLAAIAELTGQDAARLAEHTPATLRALIADGFFTVE